MKILAQFGWLVQVVRSVRFDVIVLSQVVLVYFGLFLLNIRMHSSPACVREKNTGAYQNSVIVLEFGACHSSCN
jgi:hypothetical protein